MEHPNIMVESCTDFFPRKHWRVITFCRRIQSTQASALDSLAANKYRNKIMGD